MPNRIIRESCRSSPTLDTLSAEAERLFWRLTTVADDYGRFEADPRLLLASCFPLAVDRIKAATVGKWFAELVEAGAVQAYSVEGRSYGVFVSWTKHQRVRESKPKYPEPLETPAAVGGESPRVAASCGLARALDHDSGLGSRKGKEREKGGQYSAAFLRFWNEYPRKTKQPRAARAFANLGADPPLDAILRALAWQKQTEGWRKDGGQYVPHPATYLNDRQWEDEPPPGTRMPSVVDAKPLSEIKVHPLAARLNAMGREVARG